MLNAEEEQDVSQQNKGGGQDLRNAGPSFHHSSFAQNREHQQDMRH